MVVEHMLLSTQKKSRRQILNDQNKIIDIDCYKGSLTNYTYYKPLCYQLIPITENSKHWGKENLFYYYGSKILFKLFQYNEMDKKVEPGYSRFYMCSKIIFYILIFLCIYIAYQILYKQS
jgi:hypothetical protein